MQPSAAAASPSSRGLGHRPFTAVTGVRIPLGTPIKSMDYDRIGCRDAGSYPKATPKLMTQSDLRAPAVEHARTLADLLRRALSKARIRDTHEGKVAAFLAAAVHDRHEPPAIRARVAGPGSPPGYRTG